MNIFDEASLACAMVDSKTRKLYLFRNIGNPICYTINKEQNTLLFASTPQILEAALKIQKIVLKEPDKQIIELEKGDIVCIDEDLNITKETCSVTRGARTSYLSSLTKSWGRTISYLPKKSKGISGTGFKCTKCGKKFVSIDCVENHLEDVHHIFDHLDEDEDISDFWQDCSESFVPKKLVNRKNDYHPKLLPAPQQTSMNLNVVRRKAIFIKKDKPSIRTFSSFEDMQRDTEACLKEMEKLTSTQEIDAEVS